MKLTLKKVLDEGIKALEYRQISDAKIDAMLLLEHVFYVSKLDVLVYGDKEVTAERYNKYQQCIELRANGKPLQYITHQQEFMGLDFYVNESVLIPRQDTEILVEKAIELIKDQKIRQIMDIGTGSGCIPISVCHNCHEVIAAAIDISNKALSVAKKNAKQLRVEDRITFIESNLFQNIDNEYKGNVDLIISNPPYIPTEDIDALMLEVKGHEPVGALDGGRDGLTFYKKISKECQPFFRNSGYILFEIGYNQGQVVKNILITEGYQHVEVIKDLSGLDRVVFGYYETLNKR